MTGSQARGAGARFRYYLGTVGSSSAAIGLHNTLYPWIVVSHLGLDAHMLGLAQMAAMLPHLLLILLGGAVSANRPLSPYLRKLYLLYLLPFGVLAAVSWSGALSFWHLAVFGTVFGVVSAFIQPARESLVPQVSQYALQQAVARISLVQFSAQSLGMLAAGFFDVVGLESLLLIQCALFIVASFCVGRTAPVTVTADSSKRESIGAGLLAVWNHPRLLPLMALVAATGFLGIGAYVVVVPVLAKEVYKLDAIFFAAMQLCFTAGILLSNVIFIRKVKRFTRPGKMLLLSLLLRGLLIVLLALKLPLWLAMAALVVWGALSGTSMTLGRALTHEEADKAYRSRIVSIYQLSLFGSAPLGAGFAGLLTGSWGVAVTLVVVGLLTVACAVVGIAFSGLWREPRETR